MYQICFQWQRSEKCIVFVSYRWIIAAFYAFSFVNSVIFSVTRSEFSVMMIYLSRWNLFGTMIASLMGAYLVTNYHFKRFECTNRMRRILRFYWFLSNNSVVLACVISSIYWTLLYREGQNNLNNYLVHATNSLFLVIDLFVICHPHRMSLFVYPMTCGGLYMFFTIIYTLLGGNDRNGDNFVYPILDWKNHPLKATIVGIGCVVFLGVFHAIICGLHRIRNEIHQRLTGKRNKTNDQVLPFICEQQK